MRRKALLDSKNIMRSLLILISFSLVLLSCSFKSRSSDQSLRIQLGGVPVSLDPAQAEDGLSLRILANVMEGLVGYDGAGQLKNRLAAAIDISNDQKRYTFTLRPEAKWSDGRPVVAAEFVLGIRRALAPATASKLAESLLVIRGARDYHQGQSSDLPGVRDENGKLVFELERPISFFLQLLTLPITVPARQDILNAHSGRWAEGEEWAQTPTTGPFRIASYIHDQKLILERNVNYWGPQPSVDKIEWIIVPDEITGLNLFDQGKLDILTKVPSLNFKKLGDEHKIRVFPFLATYYIGFNCRKPPFNDPRVRRAVSSVIDRKGIVDALMTGESPAQSWIPRGLEGYISYEESKQNSVQNSVIDPEVKTLLSNFPSLTLQFDSSDRNTTVMEKVQQDIKNKLGLQLNLVHLDWKSHMKSVQTEAPSLFRLAWQTPFLDPIFHLQVLTSKHSANPTGCSHAEYDRIVSEIEIEKSGPKREKLIRDAQKILVDDEAMVIPLFHYVQNYAVSQRVKNFRANPFGVIRLNELEVDHGFQK